MTRRSSALPRRFYAEVDLAPLEGGGLGVALDGRCAQTPGGAPLRLPTEALGRAVVSEWSGQGERIDMAAMPLTRLAFTAIDRVGQARGGLTEEMGRYGAHDVLCHLADTPARLVSLQEAAWSPWRRWAEDVLRVRLSAAAGLLGPVQPAGEIAVLRALAAAEDDFHLAGLVFAAALFGSAILAFALKRGALGADEAYDLSRLEEAFQEEFWGIDAEAEKRSSALRLEAHAAARWFNTLSGRPLGETP